MFFLCSDFCSFIGRVIIILDSIVNKKHIGENQTQVNTLTKQLND